MAYESVVGAPGMALADSSDQRLWRASEPLRYWDCLCFRDSACRFASASFVDHAFDLLLAKCIVLERLSAFFRVDFRRKDVVKLELPWKDVHHDVSCFDLVIAILVSIQDMDGTVSERDQRFRLHSRLPVEHTMAHKSDGIEAFGN